MRPSPTGRILDTTGLPDELVQALDNFTDFWPPDDEVIDNLTSEDVVVFAVESKPVAGYTSIRQEVISAKVLSVETDVVRGRIVGPVVHAEHHGSHAGLELVLAPGRYELSVVFPDHEPHEAWLDVTMQ